MNKSVQSIQDILDLKQELEKKDLYLGSITVSKNVFDKLIQEKKLSNKFLDIIVYYDPTFADNYMKYTSSTKPTIIEEKEKYIETSNEDFEKSWQMVLNQ